MPSKLGLSLRSKVLIVVLGTALITSGLFALWINAVLGERFSSYLDQTLEQQNLRIVELIRELYTQYADWQLVADRLDSVAPTVNAVVRVRNLNDQVVLDSTTGRMHTWMMREGTMGRGMMRGRVNRSFSGLIEEGNLFSYPITINGRQIATAEIVVLGANGRWSQEDLKFGETIQDAVLYSSLIAALLALVLSLAFARRISQPITEITKIAEKLKSGNFGVRAEIKGTDELATLAGSFNAMAERLEQTDRLRKKFTADVAHELRTPVTTIRSYIEAFQDGVLEATPERLAELEEEITRLSELISDLQTLTVVEGGKLVIRRDSFDLVATIRELLTRMNHQFIEKGIQLEVSGSSTGMVSGDRKLLLRAVANLVSNALKYTDAGGRVEVNLQLTADRFIITVSDSGVGISATDLPYIFDRFYRADPSRARSTGGSGIGLALVKEIVDAHHGRISVESTVNQGSIFTLELPR